MIRVVCGCGRVFKAEDRHSGQADALSGLRGGPDHRPDAGLELERGGPGRGAVVVVSERSAGRSGRTAAPAATATRDAVKRRSSAGPRAESWRWNGRIAVRPARSARRGGRRPIRRGPADSGPWRWPWRRRPCWPSGCCAGCARTVPGRGERGGPRRPGAGRPGGDGPERFGHGGRIPDRRPRPPSPGGPPPAGPPAATARARLHLPGGEGRKHWHRLIDAAAKVDLVVIVNPDSGPGLERNADYAASSPRPPTGASSSSATSDTDYAGRARPPQVKDDIDTWVRFYPRIAGFFLDQQPGNPACGLYRRYRHLRPGQAPRRHS